MISSRTGVLVVLLGALLPCVAFGESSSEPLAQVEALQPPVWVEREGQKYALASGAQLQAGDRFLTGSGGRLHIAMGDNSIVKLGENAELQLPRLERRPHAEGGDSGVLAGALAVVKGAFRYTTRAVSSLGGKLRGRELEIAIGPTITAGIRGTDLWGKSEDAQQLLCLIEGRIEVSSPNAAPQAMEQAGTFYVVPRELPPLPVAPVAPGQLDQWVPQTELKPASAALTADGSYLIGLESHESADAAQAAVQKFAALGYATEVIRARVGERTWYRVAINGLRDADSAKRFAAEIRKPLKLQSPWVMAPPNL